MAGKQKRRNGHAFHPIMKKGGVHEKSTGAKRAAQKRETRRMVKALKNEQHRCSFSFLGSLNVFKSDYGTPMA